MAPSLLTEAVKPIFHFGGCGVHIFGGGGEVHFHSVFVWLTVTEYHKTKDAQDKKDIFFAPKIFTYPRRAWVGMLPRLSYILPKNNAASCLRLSTSPLRVFPSALV